MLKEIFNISEYPSLDQQGNSSFIQKIATILKTYGLIFLCLILSGWLSVWVEYFVTHSLHFKSIQKQYSKTFEEQFKKTGIAWGMIYICLIGPIMEETVFRLPLSLKRVHVAICIAIAFFMFGNVIPFVKNLSHLLGKGFALGIRVAVILAIYFVVVQLIPKGLEISDKLKKRIIITSMCLFALMHIANFIPLQWSLIWVYPIYVLPQFFMGWGITYVRFKHGFVWGIVLHCLINSVSMSFYATSLSSRTKHLHPVVDSAAKHKPGQTPKSVTTD
ncbi:CPBP family intramembrane metalloprotease [Mucilaginibacter sp. BJC16-A38]|uniref:CPBP family glutamic-type intramembrane protease n=1 Tax=Mucilaginibacter phenanthrenivorans TaxID=1234842 RepID=UPI0021578DB6|nr:CPBP family glutamic-type intramembrane protease [Mucilaginibacter phenanthrenivorans]MCR8556042.1 CPBP family intramembrane metalloprotease [Mucilaginibacter phenanthrenivorans]